MRVRRLDRPVQVRRLPEPTKRARDSILFVDEFVSGERRDQLIKAFLPLLSDQRFARSIGLKSVEKSSKSNGNYYRIHNGRIELSVRFTAVFASMYSLKMTAKYVSHEALLDRCIPVQYEVTNEERDAVARGKAIFDHEPYDCPKEVTIQRKDFERVYGFWKKNSDKVHDNRALDDCLRVFAVTQEHSDSVYRFVIDAHGGLDAIKEEIQKERESRIDMSHRSLKTSTYWKGWKRSRKSREPNRRRSPWPGSSGRRTSGLR